MDRDTYDDPLESEQTEDHPVVLTAEIEATDDLISIELSGELDIATVAEVERALAVIEEKQAPVVVIDLTNLRFIDSHGLRLILMADDRLRSQGRRLVLVPGAEAALKVFRVSGLDRRLEFSDSAGDDGPVPELDEKR